MKCKNIKCGIEHDGSFGSGKYCSRPCANSRVHSAETRNKTSESMKLAHKEGRASIPKFTQEQIDKIANVLKVRAKKILLERDFDSLCYDSMRRRIIIEQQNKCNHCGIDIWMNKPLVLEIDHKDGNNKNNDRDNLEGICPNCHSLTSTWRGRNYKNKKKKVITDEEIVRAYLETGVISQTLKKVKLVPKGGNYKRVKRALTRYNVKY